MDDNGLGKFILDKLEKIDDKLDQVKIENVEARKSFDAHEHKDEDRHKDLKAMHAKISDKLSTQSEQLTEYNYQLKEHMRRTELLEIRQDVIKQTIEPLIAKDQETTIMNKYVSEKWSHRIKVLTVASLIIGMLATIIKVFII